MHQQGTFNAGPRLQAMSRQRNGFLKVNGGEYYAPNVLELGRESTRGALAGIAFGLPTNSSDYYLRKCKELKVKPHPA